MSQFQVYANPIRSRREVYPYVAQLQSDLATLHPREIVVAPLVPVNLLPARGAVLLPVVKLLGLDGQLEFTLCVPMLGTVPVARLGMPIGDIGESRWTILGAIDRLFTGG